MHHYGKVPLVCHKGDGFQDEVLQQHFECEGRSIHSTGSIATSPGRPDKALWLYLKVKKY